VHVKDRCDTMARWLLVAGLAVAAVCYRGGGMMAALAKAAESQPFAAPTQVPQSGHTDKSEGKTSVRRGMGKEAVRTEWGNPAEIRRIRTCFGWQEEWVYRGDPQRFGVSERILLFDEGEALTEIR
jgi:hypothetical protein